MKDALQTDATDKAAAYAQRKFFERSAQSVVEHRKATVKRCAIAYSDIIVF